MVIDSVNIALEKDMLATLIRQEILCVPHVMEQVFANIAMVQEFVVPVVDQEKNKTDVVIGQMD